jgi:Zn-dependent protease with chaperone function
MELMAIFRELAQAAAPAAVTALWQGTVLAAGLALCLRLAARIDAADRFRVWAAGFAVLVALPFLPFLSEFHLLGADTSYLPATAVPASKVWFDLDPRWAVAITGLWITASIWRVADLAVHSLRLRKIWKDAEPIEFQGVQVEVCATQRLDRPSVIGFFRPRILIPAWLLARLSPDELEQVVLHEAEHLRRRDDWTNLLQKLALVVFPLNPALAWVERQLCQEREMACDDAVIRATQKPRAYAACLASLAERGLERTREALSLGAWRKRPELVGRVHRILKHAPGLNPTAARALLAVVSGGLVLGSIEFARAPQLVAFVETAPAGAIAESNTPDLVNHDERTMAGFRAVNAVAHVPSSAALAQSSPRAAASRAHSSMAAEKTDKESSRGTELSPLAKSPRAYLATAVELPEQWLVLTEQVVTVRRKATTFADYDVNATAAPAQKAGQAAEGAAAGAANPTAPAVQEWTFTQLILRVDPSRSAESNAAGEANKSGTNSQPAQPAAISLQNGWLVLQL